MGIHRSQLLEAAKQEARREEQHERERHLSAHEQLPGPVTALRVSPPPCAQGAGNRRRAKKRNAPERDGRQHDEAERKQQRDGVEPHFVQARKACRTERNQQLNRSPRESKSQDSASRREQDALAEKI